MYVNKGARVDINHIFDDFRFKHILGGNNIFQVEICLSFSTCLSYTFSHLKK